MQGVSHVGHNMMSFLSRNFMKDKSFISKHYVLSSPNVRALVTKFKHATFLTKGQRLQRNADVISFP